MSLAKKFLGVFLLTILTITVGCSDDGDGGKGSKPKPKISPEQRWPETGNYSYNLNDNGCIARESFSRKYEYCVALTDREENNGCALDSRKIIYANNCGDDFEETNIEGKDWSGYDSRLQRSCSTVRTWPDKFATLTEYCGFLKDEAKHESCHWENRRAEFIVNKCAGEFSQPPGGTVTPVPEEPGHKVPAPEPTPHTTPYPTPAPTPDNRPQVFKDLEAAGINVDVVPSRSPGEEPFDVRVARFVPVLEKFKNELLARKADIQNISLTTYTVYHSERKDLSLDVVLNEQELGAYLKLFDRRLAIEKQTGILMDFGIEIYGHESGDKTAGFRNLIAGLEKQASALKGISPVVKSIVAKSYTSFFLSNQTLHIKRNDLQQDDFLQELANYIPKIQPLVGFYTFAQQIDLEVELNFEFEKNYNDLIKVIQAAEKSKDALAKLKQMGKIKVLYSMPAAKENNFWQSLGKLWIASEGPELQRAETIIKTLANDFSATEKIGIQLEVRHERLNSVFVESSRKLLTFQNDIARKKNSIKEIYLPAMTSDFSYKVLFIGSEDSDQDFQKVLAKIP